jgi:ribosomal protein S5
VKDSKIKSMEEIYLFSLPVKEFQIVDFFLPNLKDEVMKIMSMQKQTHAGQRTHFKAFVAIGDFDGHVGLGVKCTKEVTTAIHSAIILAKLSVVCCPSLPWLLGCQPRRTAYGALESQWKGWLCHVLAHTSTLWDGHCRGPCVKVYSSASWCL